MPAIDYQPEFKHTDWIDNVTRVKAGGEDGFNAHFHDIEDEFKKLSETVKAINAKLDALGQTPAPPLVTATLTPTFVPFDNKPWSHSYGYATKPPGATLAGGMMGLSLPNGGTIKALRAVGRNTGNGPLVIGLRRQGLAPSSTTELLASVQGKPEPPAQDGSFDRSSQNVVTGTPAIVNTALYRYYLTAEVDGAAAADTVQVSAIQITYTAA